MATIFIAGASRGIGLEFARQYRAANHKVIATARDAAGLAKLIALGCPALQLDVIDSASVGALPDALAGLSLDVIIINAGLLGPRSAALAPPSQDEFDAVMRTNVLGPMRLIPLLAPLLVPGGKLVLLSSQMGSIAARSATGAGLYRASKAALNSVMKEAALSLPNAITVSVHPGWVRTDMGGTGADIDVSDSVARLRQLIASLKPAQNGAFLTLDGSPIPF
jgi:NAD(P)-dependent dehydrogenase (short-subunit alcohol dehydrogenase family)